MSASTEEAAAKKAAAELKVRQEEAAAKKAAEDHRALDEAAAAAAREQVHPGAEPAREVIFDDKTKDSKQEGNKPPKVYQDWLQKYKAANPAFKEDENKFTIGEDGNGVLSFKDPKAEEDFVRELAKSNPHGGIIDKGIEIAKFENGELIDPRTKKAFPEGEYAHLVSQLDMGIAYDKTTMKSTQASSTVMAPPQDTLSHPAAFGTPSTKPVHEGEDEDEDEEKLAGQPKFR